MLLTPEAVYIGLSARTDANGAAALVRLLASLGRRAEVVTPPAGVLHLKTACSLVEEHTLLATRALAEAALFPDLDVVVVPEGEEPVANALRVNGVVLIADGFPKTARPARSSRLRRAPARARRSHEARCRPVVHVAALVVTPTPDA